MEKPDICNVEKMKYEPLNNKDMKKLLGLITALCFGLASLNAMSYEEARDRARFLTDKMAYELNLNDQQYNDAYEINLDYLMNIRTASDASSVYLEYRNADLRFILYDWQYALFQAATYFFRPVIWRTSGWFLPVYTIYSPSRFYYSPPRVYQVYRGGHYHYRHEHRQSFYAHRRPVWNGGLRGESRGPLPGRPALPPHRSGSHNGNGSPGFHFESPGRPSRPGQRPNDHRGNGFRFEPVQKPGNQGTKPDNDNKRPSVARPQSNNSNREYPVTNPQPRSHYNRRSSTRTTVNRSSVRPESSTAKPQRSPRVQSTQRIQRNSTRPSFSKPTPSVKRSPAAPRSKRESKR